jgi:hypothetical protein
LQRPAHKVCGEQFFLNMYLSLGYIIKLEAPKEWKKPFILEYGVYWRQIRHP